MTTATTMTDEQTDAMLDAMLEFLAAMAEAKK